MVFKALRDLSKDKDTILIKAQRKNPSNIYKYILEQKLDILTELKLAETQACQSVIILTRSDWRFDTESLRLVLKAFESGRIILPKMISETRTHESYIYKPLCDQFMAIPGDMKGKVIEALKTSLTIADLQEDNKQRIQKDIKLGGNGMNRFGLGPEALLGIGFARSCSQDDYCEEKFSFAFKPGTFDACSHNLLREDAAKWMQLSQYDIARKRWMHYKGKLLSLREQAIRLLSKR